MIYQNEDFIYDSETGILYHARYKRSRWGINRWTPCSPQKNGEGYLQTTYKSKLVLQHRLAYYLVKGYWPEYEIDHIDHDRANNKWSNLRVATRQQQTQNASISLNNTSGITGVNWDKTRNKWMVRISINGVPTNIGRFDSLEEATQARKDAEATHGYHENHGS